jgi:lysophospholipase L1-like esterase
MRRFFVGVGRFVAGPPTILGRRMNRPWPSRAAPRPLLDSVADQGGAPGVVTDEQRRPGGGDWREPLDPGYQRGMQIFRELPSIEAPRSAEGLARIMAMLEDAAPDPAIYAPLRDPAQVAARAAADAELRQKDWANLGRYQVANAEITGAGVRPAVVFMGDSISEFWPLGDSGFFTPGRVGRGISGQTTPQILVRFHPDVVALKPRAVHLLCGGNDIAGNTGPTTPGRIQGHIAAMVQLAQANDVRVLLGSLTPADGFPWAPDGDPKPWIAEMNAWLRSFAAARGATFLDYWTPLADEAGGLRKDFSHDGVHPNRRGYAAMRRILEPRL